MLYSTKKSKDQKKLCMSHMRQEKDGEHISNWFSSQHLGPLLSLVNVEKETQHAHIVVELETSTTNSQ